MLRSGSAWCPVAWSAKLPSLAAAFSCRMTHANGCGRLNAQQHLCLQQVLCNSFDVHTSRPCNNCGSYPSSQSLPPATQVSALLACDHEPLLSRCDIAARRHEGSAAPLRLTPGLQRVAFNSYLPCTASPPRLRPGCTHMRVLHA